MLHSIWLLWTASIIWQACYKLTWGLGWVFPEETKMGQSWIDSFGTRNKSEEEKEKKVFFCSKWMCYLCSEALESIAVYMKIKDYLGTKKAREIWVTNLTKIRTLFIFIFIFNNWAEMLREMVKAKLFLFINCLRPLLGMLGINTNFIRKWCLKSQESSIYVWQITFTSLSSYWPHKTN